MFLFPSRNLPIFLYTSPGLSLTQLTGTDVHSQGEFRCSPPYPGRQHDCPSLPSFLPPSHPSLPPTLQSSVPASHVLSLFSRQYVCSSLPSLPSSVPASRVQDRAECVAAASYGPAGVHERPRRVSPGPPSGDTLRDPSESSAAAQSLLQVVPVCRRGSLSKMRCRGRLRWTCGAPLFRFQTSQRAASPVGVAAGGGGPAGVPLGPSESAAPARHDPASAHPRGAAGSYAHKGVVCEVGYIALCMKVPSMLHLRGITLHPLAMSLFLFRSRRRTLAFSRGSPSFPSSL